MSTAKDLLLSKRQSDLRKWWVSIVNDDKFEQIKLLARSEFLDVSPNAEALQGAMSYERILEELPKAPETGEDILSQVNPGLNHDLDIRHEPDKKKK